MGWRCPTLVVQDLRCCRNTVWPWPQSPLLVVAAEKNDAPSSHACPPSCAKSRSSQVRQTKFSQKELRRTKTVATCPMSLARLKQNSTKGWVNCALHQSFGALRHETIGAD